MITVYEKIIFHQDTLFKVHMKRFLTKVFYFIIVKINIKESYIVNCEFVTRLSFLILCIHDVTEAHRCNRRNENHVIYHHFVGKILTDFVDMEEFLFSYEFPNFVVHS